MGKMRELEKKIETLEYELGRYKKAVLTRECMIEELKKDAYAREDIHKILSAYIAVLVEDQGGKARIPKEQVSEKIGKFNAAIHYEEATDDYVIELE